MAPRTITKKCIVVSRMKGQPIELGNGAREKQETFR